MSRGVLQRERHEDEADTKLTQLIPSDGVPLVVPLERGRIVERKACAGKPLADLAAELFGRSPLRGRKLTPQKVGNPTVHVAKAPIDGELYAALALWCLGGRHTVGSGDDDEVFVAEVVGRATHHPELAHELVRRNQRLARDVAAALGHDLVLEVRGGDAGSNVEVDRALDVEKVSVAGVHVDDYRWNLQVHRRDSLLRVANGHRELELAQSADRAASAVGNLDRRVDVHVRGAEVADCERIAAEVDGVETVVHDQLGAERVVDTGPEDVGLGCKQPAQPPARLLIARGGDLEAVGKQGRGYQLHQRPTRSRGRSCTAPGTRIRARSKSRPRALATVRFLA